MTGITAHMKLKRYKVKNHHCEKLQR